MAQIVVTGQEAASNTDVLNGTRLITLSLGIVIVQCLADLNDATNSFDVDLSLPGGEAPWIAVDVPGNNPSLAGVLDERQWLSAQFDVIKEGHATLAFTETGAAIVTWRVVNIF